MRADATGIRSRYVTGRSKLGTPTHLTNACSTQAETGRERVFGGASERAGEPLPVCFVSGFLPLCILPCPHRYLPVDRAEECIVGRSLSVIVVYGWRVVDLIQRLQPLTLQGGLSGAMHWGDPV